MSKTPLAPISVGDLIDKVTILRIKLARIQGEAKRANVAAELAALETALETIAPLPAEVTGLTEALSAVNATLWEQEDEVRALLGGPGEQARFVAVARAIFAGNDRRAALKRQINLVSGSTLIEEKSR